MADKLLPTLVHIIKEVNNDTLGAWIERDYNRRFMGHRDTPQMRMAIQRWCEQIRADLEHFGILQRNG